MSLRPGTQTAISPDEGSPSPGGPVPGLLTEEEFMAGMSNLRRQIDNACEELRQKLQEICVVVRQTKEIK